MSIVGTLPLTLTNGQTADAGQAMTDLNFIVSQVNVNALAAMNNLADVTNATTARSNLGLGSVSVESTGSSGHTIPFLDVANTWSAAQTFSNGISGTLTGNVIGNVSGNVTGNVTGNVSGSSGSCTGNAATATSAASATNAGHATNADNATNAGHANTADSATTAGLASSAVSLAVGDGAGISFDGNLQRWNFYRTGGVVIAYIDASGFHLA